MSKIASALLLIGETVTLLQIFRKCMGAIGQIFDYFDKDDQIAEVNEHFASAVSEYGFGVAGLTGILLLLAGARRLNAPNSSPNGRHDSAKTRLVVEERIAWALLLVIPIVTYVISIMCKATDGEIVHAANKQMPIVLFGFTLLAGVTLKLVKIAFTRGKWEMPQGESVNA